MRNDEFHMPGQDFGESLSEAGLADASRRHALLDAILRHPDAAQLADPKSTGFRQRLRISRGCFNACIVQVATMLGSRQSRAPLD